MKHFFPSSVMLTPFVVKHYEETEPDEQDPKEAIEESKTEQEITTN